MTCKITSIQKPTYAHFIVEGENTLENTMYYVQEIYRECTTKHYTRILIEEHFKGKRLGTIDIFDIVSRTSQDLFGFFKDIAYVSVTSTKQSMKFIENVAINRSLPVHIFETVKEAEEWLTSKEE